ncbi:sensor histidine kinase [Facklamia sp. DSM 111018]|uniref:histidine kinase n=1 Tax=Facklamia lactis TaxID=2749967 RepID=A0ABS0LS82_9LACT|nr:sensor histidine kinase [Facklamia lactis]MBG9981197.1 sensor histidine kinase [Facklamia lactis]MBG9986999.1 sensor histidine kinase [Facklamia lactis]
MIDFLKKQTLVFTMVGWALLVFTLIFFLMQLPLYGLLLGSLLILFILMIALILEWTHYKKKINLEEENQWLKDEIKSLKEQRSSNMKEMESYFILWIHQMKTPITAAKLLLANSKNQTLTSLLLDIENYSHLAMSYLKLTHPDPDMLITKVKMDDLIKPLLKKYSPVFIQTKTKLDYQPIRVEVITDANWSQLMVEQVLNNALKYSEGKRISIYFKDHYLTIEDQGPGISHEDLPKIFDKGYAGFNGKLNEKSSGLGLFIVKSIAQRLDQKVSVESQYGHGSKFTISFKLAD